MQEKFKLIKEFLQEMNLKIIDEDSQEELVIVDDEDNGIKSLIIDCEAPLMILEQFIMKVPQDPKDLYKRLLQMNRSLVQGAFVLDEGGEMILFRDTLQIENLNRNELEGSIHGLSFALMEYGCELLNYINEPKGSRNSIN